MRTQGMFNSFSEDHFTRDPLGRCLDSKPELGSGSNYITCHFTVTIAHTVEHRLVAPNESAHVRLVTPFKGCEQDHAPRF